MNEILVIGLGDRNRGDDGVGPAAVGLLRARFPDDRVHCVCVRQVKDDLAELVSRSGLVIFITSTMEGRAGRVTGKQIVASESRAAHPQEEMTPTDLLAEAQWLFGGKPVAFRYAVSVESMGFTQKLSPSVEKALAVVVKEAAGMIGEYLQGQVLVTRREETILAGPGARVGTARYRVGA